MSDKVETAGLREKAFEVFEGYKADIPIDGYDGGLVVRLEDAEAAIEEAERRGAERVVRAVEPLTPGLNILYERLTTDWQHHLNDPFEVGERLTGKQVVELVDAIRSRTEGETK